MDDRIGSFTDQMSTSATLTFEMSVRFSFQMLAMQTATTFWSYGRLLHRKASGEETICPRQYPCWQIANPRPNAMCGCAASISVLL